MNGVIPTDLFATKGIEYLVVIGFLVLLILAWQLVRLPEAQPAHSSGAGSSERDWRSVLRGFALPQADYLFHPGHAWARMPEDGAVVTIGWDDFARRLIGPPDEFRLPRPGTRLRAGEPGWTIGLDGRVLPMLAPVDGEVVDVNDALVRDPSIASRDPYGEGWLLRVRLDSNAAARRNLLAGSLARSWAELGEKSLHGLAEEAPGAVLGAVLADGGEPRAGLARTLAPDRWQEVVSRLLLTDPDPHVRGTGANM